MMRGNDVMTQGANVAQSGHDGAGPGPSDHNTTIWDLIEPRIIW